MKRLILSLALFFVSGVFAYGQGVSSSLLPGLKNKLSEESINIIKELKYVDTKSIADEDAKVVLDVLNQIKLKNRDDLKIISDLISCRIEGDKTKLLQVSGPQGTLKINGVLSVESKVLKTPIFVLDGKEITAAQFNELNPNDVGSINILKGEDATKAYGEKAANGVLVITTNKEPKVVSSVNVSHLKQINAKDLNPRVLNSLKVQDEILCVKREFPNTPIFILDGREITESQFNELNPNDVGSITIFKGEYATKLYGEKAANGVLVIQTKKDCPKATQCQTKAECAKAVQCPMKKDCPKATQCQTKTDCAKAAQCPMKKGCPKVVTTVNISQCKKVDSDSLLKAVRVMKPSFVNTPIFDIISSGNEALLDTKRPVAIENVSGKTIPVVKKFKKEENVVSFKLILPKTNTRKKQTIDIVYQLEKTEK